MRIKAFNAWRPAADMAAKVSCPPYDVMSSDEARQVVAANPASYLRVTKAEVDLPAGTPVEAQEVYEGAGRTLKDLCARGVLRRDAAPQLFVYRLEWRGRAQDGVVAVCHTEDYDRNVIRKHEKTRKAVEDDRTRHVQLIGAHTEPVFLAHRPAAEIARLVAAATQTRPLYDFNAENGVRNILWAAPDPAALEQAFAAVGTAYIADGHHRAAAAARVARERRARPGQTGAEEYNWFLAVLFSSDQLRILPYNRCVKDLGGMTPEQFLRRVGFLFDVTPGAKPSPDAPKHISMYMQGKWHDLSFSCDRCDPVTDLDVSILQDRLLAPVLGIEDPRRDPRIEFVGGIRGPEELVRRVDTGRAAVAFSMFPPTLDQMMNIADVNQIMPPKSTWFEPKLRSGLFVHMLDD